jgi:hypothetical protein
MENAFTTKGKLTVSIGESYLSAYEISVLKQGDIVKTTKLAGKVTRLKYRADESCVVLGKRKKATGWVLLRSC